MHASPYTQLTEFASELWTDLDLRDLPELSKKGAIDSFRSIITNRSPSGTLPWHIDCKQLSTELQAALRARQRLYREANLPNDLMNWTVGKESQSYMYFLFLIDSFPIPIPNSHIMITITNEWLCELQFFQWKFGYLFQFVSITEWIICSNNFEDRTSFSFPFQRLMGFSGFWRWLIIK